MNTDYLPFFFINNNFLRFDSVDRDPEFKHLLDLPTIKDIPVELKSRTSELTPKIVSVSYKRYTFHTGDPVELDPEDGHSGTPFGPDEYDYYYPPHDRAE